MIMYLQSSFIVLCLLSSTVEGQFFYNYEEADKEAADNSTPQQYNPPIAVSQQYQQAVQPNEKTEPNPPNESIEETETPKSQRPRRRMYRRILREGTYVEPPTASPKTFSRSVFENIGLGQAPSGVFIPQDSFLNVLKNGPLSNSAVSYVPEQRFFVQPPPSLQSRPAVQPSVQDTPVVIPSVHSSQAIQPSVQYVPENGANTEIEMPKPRNVRRQRQRARPSSRPEPVVDIDVLRTPPDMMSSNTPVPFQGVRATQGRSVSRSRSPFLIDNYQDTTQPPKTFGPSAFQNIGLGEAPQGVSIPADSLLNILRNSQPPYVAPRPIPVPDPVQISREPQEEELPPVDLPAPTTRRRSRQRSTESNRASRRRAEYQYDDGSQAMEVPEVRQQPSRSSGSSRTSRRRPEALYNDGAQAMDTSAQISRTEPRRTRVTVTRTSSTSSNRDERQQTNNKPQNKYKAAKLAIAALPEDEDDDGIPGVAGVDHPTLHTIPRTAFRCGDQPYNGYYADLETSCQVVHLCQAGGVKSSFLCPNGTIFNQEKFSCQWWYKVNCADSPKFYGINDSLYKVDNGKETDEE